MKRKIWIPNIFIFWKKRNREKVLKRIKKKVLKNIEDEVMLGHSIFSIDIYWNSHCKKGIEKFLLDLESTFQEEITILYGHSYKCSIYKIIFYFERI